MPAGVLVPDLSVRVNGTRIPPAASSDIAWVSVEEDLDALSMFTIELANWDAEQLRFSWSDSTLFQLGAEVQIQLGYVDDLTTVMTGEITSLEPTFSASQPPALTVRGYDGRHRMGRGRKVRSFVMMKDSAIAARIAQECGLRAVVTDSKITHEHVVQGNQSDLDFLRARARLIGYEMYVRDKALHFAPPQHTSRPVAILELGQDLSEFTPRLISLGQVSGTAVRGWDPKTKAAVVGTAAATAGVMGRTPGTRQAARAFGSSEGVIVDVPIGSRGEADQVAQGRFHEMALGFIQGEAAGAGRPTLRAGTVVEITGAGTRFSGHYYLTSVTHSLTAGADLRTSFTVRRNAS